MSLHLSINCHLDRGTVISYVPAPASPGGWLDIGPVRLFLPADDEEREEVLSALGGEIALARPEPGAADTRKDVVTIEWRRDPDRSSDLTDPYPQTQHRWVLLNQGFNPVAWGGWRPNRQSAAEQARAAFAARPNTRLELGE